MADAAPTPHDRGLRVRDLTVRFGRRQQVAVEGVNLDIAPGQRVGLIGESGSGKSVTALAIMGLLPENATATGSVTLNGVELLGRPDRHLTRLRGEALGMVFQEPMTALDPTMKAGRQVAEVFRLHGVVKGARDRPVRGTTRVAVLDELSAMGIADPQRVADSYPHQLSGGLRQRVLMAMALANRPDLLICDEPTTALDVTVQARVLATLRQRLDEESAGCLFISHDLAVVASMAEELVVMRAGRVVEAGPVRQVLESPREGYTRGLMATSRLDLAEPGTRLPTVADFEEPSA
ncbi:ABC transporter ATP-binding protein [Aestuariimicrobium soli]|uniref:ABC transporter ATP-binding protein n=1 Tax=Aestuariimicrobium soli TaxID=2035834 RepID=UPI003EBA973C